MFDEKDFVWIKPRKKSKFAVNIPNERNFNINAALVSELPETIGIGYNAEKMTLAIRRDDAGHTYRRSGHLQFPDAIKALVSHGMRFPARFTMVRSDDVWIGTLDPQPKQQIDSKKPPRRKKKPDMQSLAKEAECL